MTLEYIVSIYPVINYVSVKQYEKVICKAINMVYRKKTSFLKHLYVFHSLQIKEFIHQEYSPIKSL